MHLSQNYRSGLPCHVARTHTVLDSVGRVRVFLRVSRGFKGNYWRNQRKYLLTLRCSLEAAGCRKHRCRNRRTDCRMTSDSLRRGARCRLAAWNALRRRNAGLSPPSRRDRRSLWWSWRIPKKFYCNLFVRSFY